MVAKPESKLWRKVKKETPLITWQRIEGSFLAGIPDALGYHDSCAFFTVELKIAHTRRLVFSPHQIAFHKVMPKRTFILSTNRDLQDLHLFEGKYIQELVDNRFEDVPTCCMDWKKLTNILIGFNDSKNNLSKVLSHQDSMKKRLKGKQKEPSLN